MSGIESEEVEIHALTTNNPTAMAISQLAFGACTFAVRSYEYLQDWFGRRELLYQSTSLRLRNIRFFLRNQLLYQSDIRIFQADYVAITFEWQKMTKEMKG